MKPHEVAKLVQDTGTKIRSQYPDFERYISTDAEGTNLLKVRKSHWPDGVTISVPVVDGSHLKAAGASVIVAFEEGKRNRPFVRQVLSLARGYPVDEDPLLLLGQWTQLEGNPLLNWMSPACDVVILNASPVVRWTSPVTGVGQLPQGILVDSSDRLITVIPIRNGFDTLWDRVRIYHILPDNSFSHLESTVASSPLNWSGGQIFCESDGDFAIALQFSSQLIFRLRAGVFEEITLTGVGARSHTFASVFAKRLIIPEYVHTYSGNDKAIFEGTGFTESQTLAQTMNPMGWDLDQASVPAPWQGGNVAATLTSATEPIIAKNLTRMPASRTGTKVYGWISARQKLPWSLINGGFMSNWTNPFLAVGQSYSVPRGEYSESLQASIYAIDTATGTVSLLYTMTKGLTAAVEDTGILTPLTDFLANRVPTVFGPGMTFIGRYSAGQIVYKAGGATFPFSAGGNFFAFPAYDDGLGNAINVHPAPYYSLFWRAQFIGLPLQGQNKVYPFFYSPSEYDNTEAFLKYCRQLDVYPHIDDQGCQLTVDTSGSVYFAFLEPVSYLYGGGEQGYTNLGMGNQNLSDGNDLFGKNGSTGGLGLEVSSMAYESGHCPGTITVYKRHISKISAAGILLATREIVQVGTLKWARRENEMGYSLSSTLITASSSSPVPIADNIRSIIPCGRVVFALVDYHDLGPDFYPTTKLDIMRADTLDLLHSVTLWLAPTLIPSDITTPGTIPQEEDFVADGIQDTFPLTNTPVDSITLVEVNAVQVFNWSLVGDDLVFTSPPAFDDDIHVEYLQLSGVDNLIFRGGDRQQGVFADQAYSGGADSLQEWCAVPVSLEIRTSPTPASTQHTFMVEVPVTITDPPAVSVYAEKFNPPVAGGKLFKTEFTGAEWRIVEI